MFLSEPSPGKRSHANLHELAALDEPREPVHCTERSQSKMASGDSASSKDSFTFGTAMKDTSGGFADVGSVSGSAGYRFHPAVVVVVVVAVFCS